MIVKETSYSYPVWIITTIALSILKVVVAIVGLEDLVLVYLVLEYYSKVYRVSLKTKSFTAYFITQSEVQQIYFEQVQWVQQKA